MHETGKYIILIATIAILVGIVIYIGWGPKIFGWFGRLPGDIRVDSGNSRFYFPIATCIVLSIVLTLIFQLLSRFRGR